MTSKTSNGVGGGLGGATSSGTRGRGGGGGGGGPEIFLGNGELFSASKDKTIKIWDLKVCT